MPSDKRRHSAPDLPTTVKLAGTTRTVKLEHDHASDLALSYAVEWHRRAGRLKLPRSGIVRAALLYYTAHLASVPEERKAAEFQVARSATRSLRTDEDEQEAAWGRLQAIGEADPLPSFTVILRGTDGSGWVESLDARVDELVGAMNRGRTAHLSGPKAPRC